MLIAVNWAEKVRILIGENKSDVEVIVIVLDNLNTYCIASLYKAFSPEETKRISQRL
jgi:hypothetical protein